MELLSGWLSAALIVSALLRSAPALADGRPLIGVLRPTLTTSPSKAFQSIPPEVYAKVPKKYRQQMEARSQAMAESGRQMRDSIAAQVPETIQRTWVEMLTAKGISAVGIASSSAGANTKEEPGTGAGWSLRSAIETHVSQVGPARSSPLVGAQSTQQIRRTLSVRFSLADAAGSTVLPERECSAEDVSAAQESMLGSGKDLWAECGDAMVAAVSSALPLGTVKYLDPASRLPKAPNMADSIRLDIAINTKSLYRGKSLDAFEKPESFILELAGGAVAMQDTKLKTGTLIFPDETRFFMVDDGHRTYYILASADLEALASRTGPMNAQGEQTVRLERAGTEGPSIRYTIGRRIQTLLPSTGQPALEGNETTILIDYGSPSVVWQRDAKQMLSRFSATGMFPIQLARTDVLLNMALWNELAASEAPPRLIRIRTPQSAMRRNKVSESITETEIAFTTTELPKLVDFTIPSDYKRHSSPYLQIAFIP